MSLNFMEFEIPLLKALVRNVGTLPVFPKERIWEMSPYFPHIFPRAGRTQGAAVDCRNSRLPLSFSLGPDRIFSHP